MDARKRCFLFFAWRHKYYQYHINDGNYDKHPKYGERDKQTCIFWSDLYIGLVFNWRVYKSLSTHKYKTMQANGSILVIVVIACFLGIKAIPVSQIDQQIINLPLDGPISLTYVVWWQLRARQQTIVANRMHVIMQVVSLTILTPDVVEKKQQLDVR